MYQLTNNIFAQTSAAERPPITSNLGKGWWCFSICFVFLMAAVPVFFVNNPVGVIACYHGAILITLVCLRKNWSISTIVRGNFLKLAILPAISAVALASLIAARYGDQKKSILSMIDGLDMGVVTAISLLVYFCIANPLFEEAFWRGVLATKSKRLNFADFMFGSLHFIIVLPLMKSAYYKHQFTPFIDSFIIAVALVLTSYVWRQINTKTGGQRLTLLWHVLFDIGLVVGIFLVISSK